MSREDERVRRAVAICGKRGSGKSYTMGVLIEELFREAICTCSKKYGAEFYIPQIMDIIELVGADPQPVP